MRTHTRCRGRSGSNTCTSQVVAHGGSMETEHRQRAQAACRAPHLTPIHSLSSSVHMSSSLSTCTAMPADAEHSCRTVLQCRAPCTALDFPTCAPAPVSLCPEPYLLLCQAGTVLPEVALVGALGCCVPGGDLVQICGRLSAVGGSTDACRMWCPRTRSLASHIAAKWLCASQDWLSSMAGDTPEHCMPHQPVEPCRALRTCEPGVKDGCDVANLLGKVGCIGHLIVLPVLALRNDGVEVVEGFRQLASSIICLQALGKLCALDRDIVTSNKSTCMLAGMQSGRATLQDVVLPGLTATAGNTCW